MSPLAHRRLVKVVLRSDPKRNQVGFAPAL
jgi:hypothetical protein